MAGSTPVMYGIPNCGTIKKARSWLEEHGIDYEFHDYKKQGVDETQLRGWLKQFGWEQMINKRGTTWRKLDDDTKSGMDDNLALKVMLDNSSIIKRPLLELGNRQILGFDAEQYSQVFDA